MNAPNPDYERGYWNGLPTKVRRVTGVVPTHDPKQHPPLAWWRNLQGQRIRAVEVVLDGVNYGGGTLYLDDTAGQGWHKVTDGRGSPRIGHASVPLVDVRAQIDGSAGGGA